MILLYLWVILAFYHKKYRYTILIFLLTYFNNHNLKKNKNNYSS